MTCCVSNFIEKPTCFKKNCKSSMLFVILTNAKTNCFRPQNFATGVSDCHIMIGTLININIPNFEKQKIQYRSFRTPDVHALNNDQQNVELLNYEDGNENCSIDNVYDIFESDKVSIFDKHAPIKQAYVREKQLPYGPQHEKMSLQTIF